MLASLILGLLAGAAAPHAEPYVKKALESVLLAEAPLTGWELRMLAFAVCLIAAAILSAILGNSSAVALTVGAALGVFAPRAIRRFQDKRSKND